MATITKMVPRQRSDSGNSIEILMQSRNVRMRANDGGALPDSGFPRFDDGAKAKEGQHAPNNSYTEQTRAFHTSHASVLGRSSRGYTFEACKRDDSHSVQRRGSRRSRDVR